MRVGPTVGASRRRRAHIQEVIVRRFARITFSVVSILLVAAVVLQLYFAGMGVFSDPTDELFAIHGWNGRIVLPLLILLTLVFAALAKAGRRTVWLSALLIGLLILQTLIFVITGLIFGIGPETPHPPLAATMMVSLHPVNGLAILWVSIVVARRAYSLAFGAARRAELGAVGAAASTVDMPVTDAAPAAVPTEQAPRLPVAGSSTP